MASLTNSTTILLSSSDEEDLTMEMFGTDITKLNIEDQSESSDANSSDEEHDEDKKTPAYIYNMSEKQRNKVKEINNSAGDWKINGMKFRNKTLIYSSICRGTHPFTVQRSYMILGYFLFIILSLQR